MLARAPCTMARPGGGHCSSPAHVDRHCGFAWREGRRQRATRLRAAQENPIPAADTLSQRASDAQPDDLQCVGTSLDVECAIPDGESGAPSTSQPSGSGLFEWAGPANGLLYAAFLVSPFFFWGTSMVTMKGVTMHSTPLFLGVMRLLPAGFALLAWGQAKGRPQPSTSAAWAWLLAFAAIDGASFQGFLAEGLARTAAGLGSVIIDSQPLTVAVLASLLFGERLGAVGVGGLLMGVLGLCLLEVPPEAWSQLPQLLTQTADPGAAAAATAASLSSPLDRFLHSGEFYMLLAAQSMAVGTVMVRYVVKHCDSVMATAWHMVLGGFMLLGLSLATEMPELAERLAGFTPSDAVAMLYASMFGGAAGYGIFFFLASRGSLTALSSLTFLTPVFASIAGFLALDETFTPAQLGGAAVTLLAVFMINTGPKAAAKAAAE